MIGKWENSTKYVYACIPWENKYYDSVVKKNFQLK